MIRIRFSEIVRAHEDLEAWKTVGKVLVKP
jgi:hypothetical protein